MLVFLLLSAAGAIGSDQPAGACALLAPDEIAGVQGAPPVQARPSEHADGGLVAQQCFYLLPDPVRSVSLEVRRPGPRSNQRALRRRWREMMRAKDDDDAPGSAGARSVPGLDRPALWTGTPKAGSLYVLGVRAIVRVSVGGPAGVEAKIEACKTLARRVLRRL